MDAGESHTCGVMTDGAVTCWGNDDEGQATPPEGEFAGISAGYEHTCGVKTDDNQTFNEDHIVRIAAAAWAMARDQGPLRTRPAGPR